MTATKNSLFALAFLFISSGLFSQGVVGNWKTFDDDGSRTGTVSVYEKDGKYFSKIIGIHDPTKLDERCTKCKGKLKNAKKMGLIFLNDLEKISDTKYENGTILDPGNGKEYSCYMELVEPNKIKVRGYLGFSLLGRTQYWTRDNG